VSGFNPPILLLDRAIVGAVPPFKADVNVARPPVPEENPLSPY
jgi:hypothetical protein